MVNVWVNHTHGKDHWISSWWIHPSLNRPVRKQRWHHRNTRSRPLMDKSRLPPHTSLRTARHPPRDKRWLVRTKCMLCQGMSGVFLIKLTWLLHSLNSGPVITRHDCSTVTSLTMLSLQGAGICTHKNTHRFSDFTLFGTLTITHAHVTWWQTFISKASFPLLKPSRQTLVLSHVSMAEYSTLQTRLRQVIHHSEHLGHGPLCSQSGPWIEPYCVKVCANCNVTWKRPCPSISVAYTTQWTFCLICLMLLHSGFLCQGLGLDFLRQSSGSDFKHVLECLVSVSLISYH